MYGAHTHTHEPTTAVYFPLCRRLLLFLVLLKFQSRRTIPLHGEQEAVLRSHSISTLSLSGNNLKIVRLLGKDSEYPHTFDYVRGQLPLLDMTAQVV